MRMTYAWVALSTGAALGLTFTAAAGAEGSAGHTDPAQELSASEGSAPVEQARLAEVTLKLEKAFDDQFVRGAIDRDALSGPIGDVLQAMPEAARPRVQVHIAEVLRAGERLVEDALRKARSDPCGRSVGWRG